MAELNANQRECVGLITALIEGELSEEQRERLNTLFREDPSCRKLYTGVMSVHGLLLWSHELSAEQEQEMDESDAFLMEVYDQARLARIKHDAELELTKNLKAQTLEEEQRKQDLNPSEPEAKSRIIIIPKVAVYGGLAAALLLAMVLLWPLLPSRGPSGGGPSDEPIVAEVVPEARLVRSEGAVWAQEISADGVLASVGDWTLREGFAEIVMPSGASVILHGPTTFRIIDENTMALNDGRVTAEVPDRAKYFTVKTQSMDVVDLGTRFGVKTEEDGASSASVFEGRVEVHESALSATGSPRKVALGAGEQIVADASGKLAEAVTEIAPDHGYVSRWDAIKRQVGVQGQARFFHSAPASVRQGDLLDSNNLIVFEESTVVLQQPLEVMVNLQARQAATFGTAPSGRRVVSYFLHYAPEDASNVTATLQFPGRILGIVGNVQGLRQTNAMFGLETVDYVSDDQQSTYSIDPKTPDMFAIGGLQGDLLTIHLAAGELADQARVIVELPDDID